MEAYPELKAIETFQHLITRISGIENAIADRREFYNESVNINNVAIEQFPELIIAILFRFESFDLLRGASMRSNVKLRVLAERVVANATRPQADQDGAGPDWLLALAQPADATRQEVPDADR